MNSKADTIEEFRRSYNGSWFGLRHNGKVYPATLASNRQITPEHLGVKYHTTQEGAPLQKDVNWASDRLNLLRDYPDLGMVKIGATVGYLSVDPLRQWHKGYYPPNIKVHVPNGPDIKQINPNVRFTPSHPYIVWQVYNREFWHPSEAIRLIGEGEGVGYPLSPNFSVCALKEFEYPVLCYKRKTIGNYNGGWKLVDPYKIYKDQFRRETKVEAT